MWIRFDPLGWREGCRNCHSALVIIFWCSLIYITDAANIPENTGTSKNILPASNNDYKCNNVTSKQSNDFDTGLSIVSNEFAYPLSPIVPPNIFKEFLTCKNFYHALNVNHIYFQLANIFFLLSHLAPNSIHGVLYLRCTLLIGCSFLSLWGWTIACWIDIAIWNCLFVAINFIYVCTLLYRLRRIKFTKEVEQVYIAVFKPLRVTRHQFKKVLNCMKAIRQLKYQEVYAQEKVTKVDSLSLVLSGKLVVSQNGRALHIVFPNQFLDSPEWFGVSTDEYFQVSITAMEESRILLWHRDKLKLSIIGDQFLQAIFDHILGRDVVKKLLQVSETMSASGHIQQNGQIVSLGLSGGGNMDTDPEKKLFVVKKTGDSHGITALISRQLQAGGDPNAWRLGRIEETDHETPV
ncbi:popeye domain-containing protein 3-like isoform X2 [Aphidius gifuensis]|uniref:popeye domain-containing protein 3-like isoform X2 n=1 Tax=Aphidius gifuensis TaxID=684658 RepID=UPI001CDD1BD8|nr:popeye domain-containing protein 3-like isoform X2 [Aphidius gifuensis]